MLNRNLTIAAMLGLMLASTGCSSQDVPPAHKGRMFDKTGALAFWSGGKGFEGPILGPGTYFTGCYPEVRMVDCSTRTFKEPMTSMTKDGVQFALDVYVTASANCDDDNAVQILLGKLAPQGKVDAPPPPAAGAGNGTPDEKDPIASDPDRDITSRQIYNTFIRPAIGEAVRQAVSSYNANDLNSHRDELFGRIKAKLDSDLIPKAVDDKTPAPPALVKVVNFNLSNFKLPDEMANAAADRATQQVLRDKSVAEQERIKVETQTALLQVDKTAAEAAAEARKIDVVGAALHRNPEYYLRDIYFYSAEKGGIVVLPQDPKVMMNITPKKP